MHNKCFQFAKYSFCIFVFPTLLGCAAGMRKAGEDNLNRMIGSSIKGTYHEKGPTVTKIDEGDVFLFRSKGMSGCEIELTTDKQNLKVLSWRYISSPDKCFTGRGSY